MYLSSLSLQHFRSYPEKKFSFHDGLNIITGENGKGKTNILEAIYSLATIKPFRNSKKEVFIEHGQEWARIEGKVVSERDEETISLFWGMGNQFQAKRNNIACISAKEYLSEKMFSAVLFAPEDLFLPFLSPSHRRTLLARILSPLIPEYFSSAMHYEKALKQRNALLKKKKEGYRVEFSEFAFWDRILSEHHNVLLEYHLEFFKTINQHIAGLYAEIAGKEESVQIVPIISVKLGDLESTLQEDFVMDCARGSTSRGVHRDDFVWTLRELPLEEAASRGETRSVMLAFKKAQLAYTEATHRKKAIILLDDVFSELDHHHQTHLLASLQGHQCIITTTEMNIPIEGKVNIMEL